MNFLISDIALVEKIIVSIVAPIAAIVFAYLNFKKERFIKTSELNQKRLNEVYAPLFKILEPFMLKGSTANFTQKTLDEIRQLVFEKLPVVGGDINRRYYDVEQRFNTLKDCPVCEECCQNHYKRQSPAATTLYTAVDELCLAVSYEYDLLCDSLGIKRRSNKYCYSLYDKKFYRISRVEWIIHLIVSIAITIIAGAGFVLFAVAAISQLLTAMAFDLQLFVVTAAMFLVVIFAVWRYGKVY